MLLEKFIIAHDNPLFSYGIFHLEIIIDKNYEILLLNTPDQ